MGTSRSLLHIVEHYILADESYSSAGPQKNPLFWKGLKSFSFNLGFILVGQERLWKVSS